MNGDHVGQRRSNDPYLRNSKRRQNAPILGDWVVLVFSDDKMVFCQVGQNVTINKSKHISTHLAGKQYESIFEAREGGLWPLDPTEKLIPDVNGLLSTNNEKIAPRDNRSLIDTNTSQALNQEKVEMMKRSGRDGSQIIETIVENSTTFDSKTVFAQEKYLLRKQRKYLARCRMLRCTGMSVCKALHTNSPKRIMNLRQDTLAQILSYSNLWAGCQTIVYENTGGIVTGAVAQRLGGYGRIFSLYSGQQHTFTEVLSKFNLTFVENHSIHWVHTGDVYGTFTNEDDDEAEDRDNVTWPCPPQQHTFDYVESKDGLDRKEYFSKQSSRFLRKLCRTTPTEAYNELTSKDRMCDSIILATNHDVYATFITLYQYLAPCSPFCIFHECVEPLLECFRILQTEELAINLRLSDTWAREYQVLDQRTHPMMTMSQSGGYLLTGIKLHSATGRSELDEATRNEVKGKWRKHVRSGHKRARGSQS